METVVDSFPLVDSYHIKYLVGIKGVTTPSLIHSVELMVIHEGTNVYISKYGEMYNTAVIATFDAAINGSNLELRATAANNQNYVYKIARTAL